MSLTRLDVLRGLNISIWEGVWATIWMVLTTGAFQTGFAQNEIGATPFALGLMAGLPAAVNLLQIPASLYVERRGERKKFVAITSVCGRLLWIPILLIPFLLPPEARLPTFLVLLTLSSALLSLAVPGWTSWMSDLVPPSSRGEYFARRNMLAGVVAMIVPLPAGAFLDQAVKYGRFEPRLGFAILFGLACIAAIGAVTMILRQPEPPMIKPEGERPNPLKSLALPFADPSFRPFITFAALTVVGQTLAGQFFIAWQVGKDGLNQPYLVVQIIGIAASAAGLLTTPLWGYLADKYGSRPILMIATAGTTISPLIWMLTRPETFGLNIGLIILLNLTSGASWAGVGLTQFNLLLSLTPPANRSTYVAVFSATTGLIGGVAPIIGGILMSALQPVLLTLGPVVINNYKILFLLTSAIRFLCIWLLSRVPIQDSHPTRYVLEQLAAASPLTSYFAARRLSRPASEFERREAVRELGEIRSPLAVEELTAALEDVSPEVRERAARSLAAIRDPRAIPALAAKLSDPASGLGELAAEALGAIGNPSATPYLIAAVEGPDAGVRLAAVKALGRVAHPEETPEAIPALMGALNLTHPTSCEAACLSLINLAPRLTAAQAGEPIPRLLYLLAPEVARGMRFAAARALGALTPTPEVARETSAALENRMSVEEDPAVLAQEAVALTHQGIRANLPVPTLLSIVQRALDRSEGRGLTYKQTLDTLADLALGQGTFYPYLGLGEMARDEAVNRLLTDLRDLLKKQNWRNPNSDDGDPAVWAVETMESYTGGEYTRFFHLLAPAASALPLSEERQQVLKYLANRAREDQSGPLEALLALLLVHP